MIDTRTENVDIWPTLLDLLGLPPLEPSDGSSLVPVILAAARGEPPPQDGTPAFAHSIRRWGQGHARPSCADGGGRLRRLPLCAASSSEAKREELFDRSSDPIETIDVQEKHPEVTERLRAAAREYLERQPPWTAQPPDLELDEMQRNQLRALGYAVP